MHIWFVTCCGIASYNFKYSHVEKCNLVMFYITVLSTPMYIVNISYTELMYDGCYGNTTKTPYFSLSS